MNACAASLFLGAFDGMAVVGQDTANSCVTPLGYRGALKIFSITSMSHRQRK